MRIAGPVLIMFAYSLNSDINCGVDCEEPVSKYCCNIRIPISSLPCRLRGGMGIKKNIVNKQSSSTPFGSLTARDLRDMAIRHGAIGNYSKRYLGFEIPSICCNELIFFGLTFSQDPMERRYRAALRTLERNARELKKERRQAAAVTGTDMPRGGAPSEIRSGDRDATQPT